MLTYDLAKQLKDAGFLFQETHSEAVIGKRLLDNMFVFGDGKSYYEPTLSELISECVEYMVARNTWQNMDRFHFFELAPNINVSGEIDLIGKVYEWRATWSTGSSLDDIDWSRNFFGKTPEEAVAKLWLLLHGRK
ncbi:MAG: hypothetical protein ACLGJB_03840 [Blastocatellia bacterium]